jgi:hypothetical protein
VQGATAAEYKATAASTLSIERAGVGGQGGRGGFSPGMSGSAGANGSDTPIL